MLTDNNLWLLRLLAGLPGGFHEGLPEREGVSAAQMETDIGALIRARAGNRQRRTFPTASSGRPTCRRPSKARRGPRNAVPAVGARRNPQFSSA